MAVIEAIDLVRTYQTTTGVIRRKRLDVEAVRGISFSVEQGELFGLLGPNGAGKTTTIKMLITLLLPTSGEARVLGRNVVDDAREIRKRIAQYYQEPGHEHEIRVLLPPGSYVPQFCFPEDAKAVAPPPIFSPSGRSVAEPLSKVGTSTRAPPWPGSLTAWKELCGAE